MEGSNEVSLEKVSKGASMAWRDKWSTKKAGIETLKKKSLQSWPGNKNLSQRIPTDTPTIFRGGTKSPICACGERFSVNHELSCRKGGFIMMRHNNVRDFFTVML